MPYTDESDGLGICHPAEVIHVGVELLCDILLCAGGEVIDAESVSVALISVVCHALPCNAFAVGRELGVDVVARVVLQILGRVHSLEFL